MEVQELCTKYGKQAGIGYLKLTATAAKDTTGSTSHTKLPRANQQKFVDT